MKKPRVLLADDWTIVVEAFKKRLELEFEVVATVLDGRTLSLLRRKIKPDVVVVNIGMPLLNGMDAGKELKALLPRTKLIVLNMNEGYDLAVEALHQWASGCLLRRSASELVKAIREVLKGNCVAHRK